MLELFDGDGNVWTDVINGTFLGSPVGCDANQDFLVDAGDLSCKILLIFNGAGACVPPASRFSGDLPELHLGQAFSSEAGEEVVVSLNFKGHGQAITAGAFSIDYDENCLSFDPEGGISFALPAGFAPSASFDASDTDGELNFSFLKPLLPFATLPDGTMATLTFTQQCDPADMELEAPVRFNSATPLSFGDEFGQSVPGVAFDGGVILGFSIFVDGFESGDLSFWGVGPIQRY